MRPLNTGTLPLFQLGLGSPCAAVDSKRDSLELFSSSSHCGIDFDLLDDVSLDVLKNKSFLSPVHGQAFSPPNLMDLQTPIGKVYDTAASSSKENILPNFQLQLFSASPSKKGKRSAPTSPLRPLISGKRRIQEIFAQASPLSDAGESKRLKHHSLHLFHSPSVPQSKPEGQNRDALQNITNTLRKLKSTPGKTEDKEMRLENIREKLEQLKKSTMEASTLESTCTMTTTMPKPASSSAEPPRTSTKGIKRSFSQHSSSSSSTGRLPLPSNSVLKLPSSSVLKAPTATAKLKPAQQSLRASKPTTPLKSKPSTPLKSKPSKPSTPLKSTTKPSSAPLKSSTTTTATSTKGATTPVKTATRAARSGVSASARGAVGTKSRLPRMSLSSSGPLAHKASPMGLPLKSTLTASKLPRPKMSVTPIEPAVYDLSSVELEWEKKLEEELERGGTGGIGQANTSILDSPNSKEEEPCNPWSPIKRRRKISVNNVHSCTKRIDPKN